MGQGRTPRAGDVMAAMGSAADSNPNFPLGIVSRTVDQAMAFRFATDPLFPSYWRDVDHPRRHPQSLAASGRPTIRPIEPAILFFLFLPKAENGGEFFRDLRVARIAFIHGRFHLLP